MLLGHCISWSVLIEVRFLLSHWDWKIGMLSFLMILCQEMAAKSLRKTFLGYKTGKRLEEDLYIKGAENKFTMESSLK